MTKCTCVRDGDGLRHVVLIDPWCPALRSMNSHPRPAPLLPEDARK